MRPYLLEAFAYSKRPDVHMWLNRFPPQHLEGYEHLIQDPYKLNDEVRGRKEEFARLVDDGVWLDCRDPARCRYCYVERLCDTLEAVLDMVDARDFDVVRVDTEWEKRQPADFGGDPASEHVRGACEACRWCLPARSLLALGPSSLPSASPTPPARRRCSSWPPTSGEPWRSSHASRACVASSSTSGTAPGSRRRCSRAGPSRSGRSLA